MKTERPCNLQGNRFQDFADYLTEVVRHYQDEYGIVFQALEPVNEPSDGGWWKGGKQEGCWFGYEDMNRLFPLVGQSLKNKNLTTKLVGTDGWGRLQRPQRLPPQQRNRPKLFKIRNARIFSLTPQWQRHGGVEDPYTALKVAGREFQRGVGVRVDIHRAHGAGHRPRSDAGEEHHLERKLHGSFRIRILAGTFALDNTPRYSIVQVHRGLVYRHLAPPGNQKHNRERKPHGSFRIRILAGDSCPGDLVSI